MPLTADNPFPGRLHQARQMRGLSLRELAVKTGDAVSYAALSKYEHGRMSPSSTVLIALADALGQSPDFFFRPFRLALTDVRFRKKSRLGATDERAFLEQARNYFERYREIEELVGDVRTFHAPFGKSAVRTPGDAEKLATQLRDKWKLGADPLPNVQQLLEDHGIKVFELLTEDRQFDGLKAETEAGPVVVLASWLNGNLPRKRMTEIHELAHIVLPIADGISEAEEEKLCMRFAGAFLLPEQAFRDAFGVHRNHLGIGELVGLKQTFGASIMAIMKRAEQLGLITSTVFEKFCLFANQHHWRSNGEPGDSSYSQPEGCGRFRLLVLRAVAEEMISASSGAEFLGIDLHALRKEMREIIGWSIP